MDNKNLPAFPVECSYDENKNVKGCQTGNTTGWEMGMSKREKIAAMALQGILSGNTLAELDGKGMWDAIATDAITAADALLAQLNKQPAP